jgi:hypothetical protein
LHDALGLLFDESAQDAAGHPFSKMVSVYADSLSSTGRSLVPGLLIFALAMATLHDRFRPIRDAGRGAVLDRIAWAFGGMLLISWAVLPRDPVWAYLGNLIAFIGFAAIIGLLVLESGDATLHGPRARRISSLAVAGVLIVPTGSTSVNIGSMSKQCLSASQAGRYWQKKISRTSRAA